MQTAANLGDFHALHPVSAKTGDGIGELRDELVALLPEGPLYFPADQRTDLPRRGADRRARPREGAPADARRGAARDLRRGGRARREGAAREHPRRDRVAEADPRRQGRRDGAARSARGPARRSRRCSAGRSILELHRQGAAALAPQRGDARAARASSSLGRASASARGCSRPRVPRSARTAGLALASAASWTYAACAAEPLACRGAGRRPPPARAPVRASVRAGVGASSASVTTTPREAERAAQQVGDDRVREHGGRAGVVERGIRGVRDHHELRARGDRAAERVEVGGRQRDGVVVGVQPRRAETGEVLRGRGDPAGLEGADEGRCEAPDLRRVGSRRSGCRGSRRGGACPATGARSMSIPAARSAAAVARASDRVVREAEPAELARRSAPVPPT